MSETIGRTRSSSNTLTGETLHQWAERDHLPGLQVLIPEGCVPHFMLAVWMRVVVCLLLLLLID